MSARARIEGITNGWYAMVLIGGLVNLVMGSWGFFSLFFSAASIAFGLFITWFLGGRLLARSSITRFILVVLSGLGMVIGGVGILRFAWGSWTVSSLVMTGLLAGNWWMNFRSFTTLRDTSVKSYFA